MLGPSVCDGHVMTSALAEILSNEGNALIDRSGAYQTKMRPSALQCVFAIRYSDLIDLYLSTNYDAVFLDLVWECM